MIILHKHCLWCLWQISSLLSDNRICVQVQDLCKGNSSCAFATTAIKSLASTKLPMLDSSDCKKGQKNLLTIEYICGEQSRAHLSNLRKKMTNVFPPAECKDWFSSLDNGDCLAEVLWGNNWASEEELEAGDLRGRLEEQLSRFATTENWKKNACFLIVAGGWMERCTPSRSWGWDQWREKAASVLSLLTIRPSTTPSSAGWW